MGGYFNEMGARKGSLIWEIFELFEAVCNTRCIYGVQLDALQQKLNSAEESGDDQMTEKYEKEWDAVFEEFCETCPLHLIAIGKKEDK